MNNTEKVALFVSWSGDTSKRIAEMLKEWLTTLFDDLNIFFTPDDIPTGTRWSRDLSQKLQECEIGIFVYTSQNLDNLWMAFEAGALSKSMDTGRVIPLLFRVNISDLKGPLSQFQARRFTQDGFLNTLEAINNCLIKKKSKERLSAHLNQTWSYWEPKINEILGENQETNNNEKPNVVESLDNLYALIQTSPWHSTEFPNDISKLVHQVNDLVQQVRTTRSGSYLFIDGEKPAISALTAATMRAKKTIRSTRLSPPPISGNYDDYGEAIKARVIGTNDANPVEKYTRIIAANNPDKLKDIDVYLDHFLGRNFDLYLTKSLTKRSNSFELVIIDEEELFVHFQGQEQVIKSTLHIVGEEVTRNFINIYEQLHDPKYDPDILKVEFKYMRKDEIDQWRNRIQRFFNSSQGVSDAIE
jgi:hypothetical protein